MVFKAGSMGAAARFMNGLFDLENKVGDDFSLVIADKKNAVRDAEISIILDGSIRGIKEFDSHAKENIQKSHASDWTPPGRNKPSGPVEWVRSKLPF